MEGETFWNINTMVLKYMHKRGKSANEIAEAIGTSPFLVHDRILKLGLPTAHAPRRHFKNRNQKYRFHTIPVGEHRDIPAERPIRVMNAAYMFAEKNSAKFKCRSLPDNVVRVTRLA